MTGPDLVGSERDVLVHYLRAMREAVIATTAGVDETQVRAAGVPSGTSLLGIVHHLAGVERHWFRKVFAGEDVDVDLSMSPRDGSSLAEVVAEYRAAGAESDAVIARTADLSTLAAIVNPGEDELDSLRRIIAHMIRETARHAGQADILRELIDGVTETG